MDKNHEKDRYEESEHESVDGVYVIREIPGAICSLSWIHPKHLRRRAHDPNHNPADIVRRCIESNEEENRSLEEW